MVIITTSSLNKVLHTIIVNLCYLWCIYDSSFGWLVRWLANWSIIIIIIIILRELLSAPFSALYILGLNSIVKQKQIYLQRSL